MKKGAPPNSKGREVTIKLERETPSVTVNKTPEKPAGKTSIKNRFLILSVILFLVIMAGGGIAFFISNGNEGSAMAWLLFPVFIVILLIFIIINIQIFRMVKPLDTALDVLGEIAETRDLTRRFNANGGNGTGDLAEILNMTFSGIQDLVTIISDRAINLAGTGAELADQMVTTAGSINQISSATQLIREQTGNQSVQIDHVNKSMANIIGLVEKLGGHINNQADNVNQSSSAIEQMFANISMVANNLEKNAVNVHAMKEVSGINRKDLEAISAEFHDITRQSEGLLEINAVIENIASQTNLLSMNAAIEAAHAGESGKGFAVVAGEIRKLAEDASKQSKTIAEMLKKIKTAIDTITASITRVLGRFEDMDGKVKTIADKEDEIRGAMEEQESGSRQVLEAITQLKDLTGVVRNDTAEIVSEGQMVIEDSNNLSGIAAEIERGMREMAAGTEHINTSVRRVNEISGGNKSGIDALITEVNKFKIR